MKRMLAAAAVLSAAWSAAYASPEGGWPESARGVGLPQPDWVLVIPARRDGGGALVPWSKEDPWTREWIVPKATPRGMRTVAVTGDAEDRRVIDGWLVDSMDVEALSRLADKYGAPAVAVAVMDESGDTAVAAWSPGNHASWDHGGWGRAAREGVLAAIDGLFSGQRHGFHAAYDVRITGQRGAGYAREYRIEAEDEAVIDLIDTIPGLRVAERLWVAEGAAAAVSVTDGRAVEDVLRGAGLIVGTD